VGSGWRHLSEEGGTVIDADQMISMRQDDLDELFRSSPTGDMPEGRGRGTVVFAPHTLVGRVAAKVSYLLFWQGKVFDQQQGDLRNLVSPFRLRLIRARVYEQASWFDGRPCIVLDYSKTSWVAKKIRDEIREVDDGVYLGLVFWGSRQVLKFTLEFPRS
jgi:hypothetical protein